MGTAVRSVQHVRVSRGTTPEEKKRGLFRWPLQLLYRESFKFSCIVVEATSKEIRTQNIVCPFCAVETGKGADRHIGWPLKRTQPGRSMLLILIVVMLNLVLMYTVA